MFPDEVLRSPRSPMRPANSKQVKWIVQSNSAVPQQRYRVGYPASVMATEWSKDRVPCMGCMEDAQATSNSRSSAGSGDMRLRAIPS